MSDQELDDLFKEASAKYEAPFDEKEWEKMAALLDNSPSPKPGFWNWKIISGLALLLLMSGTLLVTQWDKIGSDDKSTSKADSVIVLSHDELSSTTESLQAKGLKSSEEGATESAEEDKNTLGNADSSLPSEETNSSQLLTAKGKSVTDNSKHPKLETLDNTSKKQVKEIIKENTKENGGAISASDKKSKKQPTTLTSIAKNNGTKQSVAKNSAALTAETATNEKDRTSVIKSTESKGEKAKVTAKNDRVLKSGDAIAASLVVGSADKELAPSSTSIPSELQNDKQKENSLASPSISTAFDTNDNRTEALLSSPTSMNKKSDSSFVVAAPIRKDSAMNKEATKKEKHSKIDSAKLQRFSLKFALSPDFSSIGYFNPGKTGFNYGLLAEYAITRHWSLTVGGIWSKKSYADTKTENLGYGAVNSTRIDGSCRVLDLPLNINYYYTPQNAFTLYGSVGLSSYFMFDEDYTYDYVYGAKQYSYSKKIDRGNTEWFRMMNLSIGIQQQLSARMRLQLEPFIKAPLSGIGGGDLKLVSSGVFLNLKYTFK